MRVFIASFICCCTFFTQAAQVYKCTENGVTAYSDRPCSKDAKKVRVFAGGGKRANSDNLIEKCLTYIKENRSWKDPDSVKVVSHNTKWTHDDSGARQLLMLRVKAKNSYGAYDGTTQDMCFLDHNGTGLSTIQKFVYY